MREVRARANGGIHRSYEAMPCANDRWLVPVAPVRGRSEEESVAQENSCLIHLSNPCSLSLVPVKSFGMNQNPFGGGPGSSGSGYVSSGSVLTEEKSRGGSGGPYFSSSMQSKQLYTQRPHHPLPSSYSRFIISSWHPLQSAQKVCATFICISTSSHVYRLFLCGEFSKSQASQAFHLVTSSCCVFFIVFHLLSVYINIV